MRATESQGVDVVGPFIGVERLEIHHVAPFAKAAIRRSCKVLSAAPCAFRLGPLAVNPPRVIVVSIPDYPADLG
jgi:hypothetical protein